MVGNSNKVNSGIAESFLLQTNWIQEELQKQKYLHAIEDSLFLLRIPIAAPVS